MIWGYPYFWKHPNLDVNSFCTTRKGHGNADNFHYLYVKDSKKGTSLIALDRWKKFLEDVGSTKHDRISFVFALMGPN